MDGEERAVALCLDVLRWLGLSFTRIRRTPEGDFVAEDSKLHLLANVTVAGVFAFAFYQIDPSAFEHAGDAYKSSTVVYPLYTKLMLLTIVAFCLCGNAYNRKSARMMNLFVRVTRALERDLGRLRRRKGEAGRRTLLRFCLYAAATTAAELLTDAHLTVRYRRTFRVVHYLCFYYATAFTAHFVAAMDHARGKFEQANGAFGRLVAGGRGPEGASPRRKLGAWMEAAVDLREAKELADEIFGKQAFLTLLLASSSLIVNAYYFITLNLYGTSNPWLNAAMWMGFLQSLIVAVLSTRAAEAAANEANRINEIIFYFPVHVSDWRMFNQIKYFALFSHGHPVRFKAWIFYDIDYDSLLKVMLTSAAITAIILQCDFLRFHVSR